MFSKRTMTMKACIKIKGYDNDLRDKLINILILL